MTSNYKGQILAEVVVAIGIIAMILISASSLMSRSSKTIRGNSTKEEASALVLAQLRFMKEERDRDAETFFATTPGTYSCTWNQPTPSPVLVPINCSVNYSDITNGFKIIVTATWTEQDLNDSSVSMSSSLMKF